MSKTRKFKVGPGRTFVPPMGTLPGPGATHARFAEGETFELDARHVDRFIRRSLNNGDLIEVTSEPAAAAAKTQSEK